MKKLYKQRFKGNGGFPIDMLRYDECWPATADDAVAITMDQDYVTVMGTNRFTIDRWKSFGWFPVEADHGNHQ